MLVSGHHFCRQVVFRSCQPAAPEGDTVRVLLPGASAGSIAMATISAARAGMKPERLQVDHRRPTRPTKKEAGP
jgi:hypothetical protein